MKPKSLFRVTNGDFLLCYKQCGFYLDKFGRRSRPDFIVSWSGCPIAFSINLFLIYSIHRPVYPGIQLHIHRVRTLRVRVSKGSKGTRESTRQRLMIKERVNLQDLDI
jgi:hypothetical protein